MLKRISVLAMAMALIFTCASFGYSKNGDWSSYKTVDLNASDGWIYTGKYSVKQTTNDIFTVRADSKTMTSSPKVKQVNSEKAVRSSAVAVNAVDTNITTETSTATKGYEYQSKITPAINQIGQDSIKYKVMSD